MINKYKILTNIFLFIVSPAMSMISFDGYNADISYAHIELNEPVVYPNPYIVVTGKGYTKHYYANGERLATTLGIGEFYFISPDVIDNCNNREANLRDNILKPYTREYPFLLKGEEFHTTENVTIEGNGLQQIQYQCPPNNLYQLSYSLDNDILLPTMHDYQYINPYATTETYFTHNDHLGSASWITDAHGSPTQYIHYLPYGQLLVNQRLSTYDERFKFIGKERDWESGYDYFGARYYISPFMHFASVEPLLDKYLHISPYSYAAWNPIKYYDFNLSNVNKGTTSASPTPKENLLNSLNTFEGAMIQSPVIQGTAAGLLTVGGAIAIGEAASMVTPTLLETGVQLQGLTLQGINVVGESSMLQVGAGMVEGFSHSLMRLPPDAIHLSNTPLSEFGYGTGQLLQNLLEDGNFNSISNTINQIIYFHKSNNSNNSHITNEQ